MPDYAGKFLAAFEAAEQPGMAASPGKSEDKPDLPVVRIIRSLIEPLSQRELEVLRLLRSELSGPEIAQQLFVSLNTLGTQPRASSTNWGSTTAGRPSAAPRNWVYSSRPEITNPGPGRCHRSPAGAFRFPPSITTSITSCGDDNSPHPAVSFGQIKQRKEQTREQDE